MGFIYLVREHLRKNRYESEEKKMSLKFKFSLKYPT